MSNKKGIGKQIINKTLPSYEYLYYIVRLISLIYIEFLQINKKTITPILKWGKEVYRQFIKEEAQMHSKYKEMFNTSQ